MKEPEPLAVETAVPSTENATVSRGDDLESAGITFDVDPEELGRPRELFKFQEEKLVLFVQKAWPRVSL
jgi:hypothetical protein